MRRHLFDLVVLFLFISIAAIYIALAQPGVRNVTLHAYVLLVGGLIMLGVVAAAGDAVPKRHRSEFDRALGEAARGDRPLHEVERMEREVTLGAATAYDLHVRLVPQLRQIAQARLERTGRVMSPETLGRWWELLRPDRPAPENRHGPGISQNELRALVSDLERM
ncbi:MAG: hypothetical protein M3P41_16580 [Actinomycetota bacterium]|nr:hypothetical protein [Actinomycetota bacterium]